MTSSEYGKIFSKNLKRIAYDHQRTQADIARDLGLKQGTVSTWMLGTRVPRMDKIDLLCDYFNVPRSALMEPHDEEYYQNQKAASETQQLFDSDLQALLGAAKGCPPEIIRSVTEMFKTLKETNPNG